MHFRDHVKQIAHTSSMKFCKNDIKVVPRNDWNNLERIKTVHCIYASRVSHSMYESPIVKTQTTKWSLEER